MQYMMTIVHQFAKHFFVKTFIDPFRQTLPLPKIPTIQYNIEEQPYIYLMYKQRDTLFLK